MELFVVTNQMKVDNCCITVKVYTSTGCLGSTPNCKATEASKNKMPKEKGDLSTLC